MNLGIGWCCALLVCSEVWAADARQQLHAHLGDTPALVAVVCGGRDEDQATIAELLEQTPWTIICQGDGEAVARIRDWAWRERLLGGRLSVIDDSASSLWLADDMASAVWVLPGVDDAPTGDELLRVLHPGGLAVTTEGTLTKPARPGTDQWQHPHRAPDNNIVSEDTVARLPGELRFQTEPVFAAMPNQTLFAGGRIFFFTGHIAFHEREEPLLNRLTVLNAYNGLPLWNRPLDPRYVVHNFSKVATDREVLFAEGGTLRVLDAATGHELGAYEVPDELRTDGETDWKWLAQQDGLLWAAFGPPDGRVAPHRLKRRMGHWPWDVADAQYRVIVENFGAANTLAAFRFPEMELVWSVREPEPFDVRALCLEGGRILQLAPTKYLAALDANTGARLWRHTSDGSEALEAIGDALKRQGWGLGWATFCCARARDGVVCIAGPPFKRSVCLDLADGRLLWSSDNESPHPFFLDDALYVMPRVAQTAVCQRLEPRTGAVLEEFELGVIGSCTRLTATPDQFYYRPGGGEGRTVYFDVAARQQALYEGVVRPGCFDGVVPANGRLYWMPLACDCWQVHGTFCMAPRQPLTRPESPDRPAWKEPTQTHPATETDWPMYRADAAGSSTVAVAVPRSVTELWRRQLNASALTAPIRVGPHVFVGGGDGSVTGLDAASGDVRWTAHSRAAVTHPPAYWNGRLAFGSCDGFLYVVDAATGRLLGHSQIAPEKRLVNIMNRWVSAWPLGGGVVVGPEGVLYAAAGSTAADGAVVAAVDLASGRDRWRQAYTLDRPAPALSFGVQSNLLLTDNRLLINGGAPVGIVALDAQAGTLSQIVARLDNGQEMFLEPDGAVFCAGPELYSNQQVRTTIFKRHQGRAYFHTSGRHIALIDGRLFAAPDTKTLDAVVDKMNSDPTAGGDRVFSQPWDVLQVPVPDTLSWAGETADVRGVAVGTDGLIVLHQDHVEALSPTGESLWTVALPAPPVRWGLALTDNLCVITLTDGQIIALGG